MTLMHTCMHLCWVWGESREIHFELKMGALVMFVMPRFHQIWAEVIILEPGHS